MNRLPVRARRWLLCAAPMMALCGVRWGAGGAAAGLAIWLLLSSPFYSSSSGKCRWPKKHAAGFHRFFLAFSLCICLTGGWNALFSMLSRPFSHTARVLEMVGAACFSLLLSEKALSMPLPRKLTLGFGALLCAFFLVFFL